MGRRAVLAGAILLAGIFVVNATDLLTRRGRYFVDSQGKARILTGGHVWASLQDTDNLPPDYTWDNWVNMCVATNWTFQRLWTLDELYMSRGWVAPLPFARPGPGLAADGKPKIDLRVYNPEFFERFSSFTHATMPTGLAS
jgi:hypothetical protein